MKAAMREKYGPPEILRIVETERPSPKDNEILVRVFSATVNRTDCGILWGYPFIIRFFTGLSKPKFRITGTDFAGEIEETGKNVTAFKVGDKVWGLNDNGLGSHAEYMVIGEDDPILAIPSNMTFSQAAACPEGAHYAINFVNKVKLVPGQKVLVNGATGAIGSAALQVLKYYGVYVTAVCNTKNMELVKSLGADKVIDYTQEDFTKDPEKYDFVFDAVGKSTFGKCKSLLKQHGIYISSELGPGAQNVYYALLTRLLGGKKVKFPLPVNIKLSMDLIQDLVEKGRFKPVIDREYPLDKIREAYHYVASGQKTGNVVLSI